MTIAKSKIASIFMAIVMLFCACFMLSACKDKSGNSTFTSVQLNYNEMLEDYADVFNSAGEVSIVYHNAQLNALIYSDENFAKLGSSALYEPVLNAGIKIFAYYVPRMDIEKISVSKKHAEPVYNALQGFKTKLDAFMLAKSNLEARETIDPEGVIEQSLLAILCDRYKDLVNSACSLGDKFSQLYHQDVFEDYVPNEGQRYAIGKMRLVVLDKLNEFAKLEANNRMIYYQDKPYTSSVAESNCVRVLNAFNKVKNIALWEGDEAELSAEETSIVKLFSAMLNYDAQYEQAVSQYMLHRLCGPPSIPLSFSLAAVVPRR